ncbi:MAG: hypothetical protein AAFP80_02590 [Pseudomonadota bacterium]
MTDKKLESSAENGTSDKQDDAVELEALRQRVRELEEAVEFSASEEVDEERREIVKAAWVAPVVLSVNLPNSVFAQSALSPVGTQAPTSAPTGTFAPTSTTVPTLAPVPSTI